MTGHMLIEGPEESSPPVIVPRDSVLDFSLSEERELQLALALSQTALTKTNSEEVKEHLEENLSDLDNKVIERIMAILDDRSKEDRELILERINQAFKTQEAVRKVQKALAIICGENAGPKPP